MERPAVQADQTKKPLNQDRFRVLAEQTIIQIDTSVVNEMEVNYAGMKFESDRHSCRLAMLEENKKLEFEADNYSGMSVEELD